MKQFSIRGTRVQLTILASCSLFMVGIYMYVYHCDSQLPTIRNHTFVPFEYQDSPDLRVIVLTSNRAKSLEKLLKSVEALELDGDSASLEIWIDRSPGGEVDRTTAELASAFQWTRGTTRVHLQRTHAGIYGQWLESWRPRPGTREMALILEDDLSVSPYAYRWLKAMRGHYGQRPDVAGYTLTSNLLTPARGPGPIPRPHQDVVFMYKLLGSHGFAPHPEVWRKFQDWYEIMIRDETFRPYVKDLLMTTWYKGFEKRCHEHSMWEMWFVYYCEHGNLFTVFNNIAQVFGLPEEGYLVEHRREPGLHYTGEQGLEATHLLKTWKDSYIQIPNKTTYLEFDGKIVMTK